MPPLLIALPDGINVSGVAMWAVRLVNALVEHGGEAGLVLHPEPRGQGRVGLKIDSRVKMFRCAERFGEGADLGKVAEVYRGAVREMAGGGTGGGPVVVSPNLHGDCYGVVAKITQECDVRVLGWQHSDNEYDARVLAHYEQMVSRFVGVSDAIVGVLKEKEKRFTAEAQRALREEEESARKEVVGVSRVVNIPYGVAVPGEWPARRQASTLRLLYTGRMEHMQKRVLALVFMSEELDRRRVPHSLTLIGDGPAAAEVDERIGARANVRRIAPLGPLSVAAMLEEHDALVLPSRFEGLSVSVLEALAHGCVPIVARTRSGAAQALGWHGLPALRTPVVGLASVAWGSCRTGVGEAPKPVARSECGIVVDVGEDAEEEEVGAKMAAAVEGFAKMDRAVMSRKAWERAREWFSIETHVEKVERVMREVVGEAGRVWPREREWAFTLAADTSEVISERARSVSDGMDGRERTCTTTRHLRSGLVPEAVSATGSVPAEGSERMRALLESLAGRSIVIHGTGEHTRQLKEVIVNAPVKIVAFADDDRGKHGTRLWDWPVISPREAGGRGATDVVISSWMHQEAVWGRRGVYEGMGVRVWRVY